MTRLASLALLLSVGGLLSACSDDGPAPVATRTVPATLEAIVDPARRITDLEVVEDLSEAVANALLDWGDSMRRRAFDEVADGIADDFFGHDVARLGVEEVTARPLGIATTRVALDAAPPVVDKAGFVLALRSFLAPYTVIDEVLPKLKQAEFAVGEPTGVGTVKLTALGRGPDGGRMGRVVWFRARFVEGGGTWRLERLVATSFDESRRAAPLFTDVAGPAGVAFRGPRFGTEGNDSFFWEGAASADVDGDGRFDLFVPSDGRNFLYRNVGDGTFEEIAAAAGVVAPGDGTAALFLDADHDGRVDLLVGQTGFREKADVVGGPNRLYRNVPATDGAAVRFEDITEEAGFGALHVTFSLAAADVDNDGFVDVHVASYNAEGFTAPDSWHEAANGTPNALYMNRGGPEAGTFEDRAEAAGVADARWSYAGSFCDFDEDGDQDLYVANDYAANALYRNRGDGTFEDVAAELGVTDVGNGMGVTWGDHDSDGDLDLYVSNMSSTAGNRILKRLASAEGDGVEKTLFKLAAGNTLFTWNGTTFEPTDAGGTDAAWAWSAQFDDFDIDGHQDLLCVNGFISGQSLKDT